MRIVLASTLALVAMAAAPLARASDDISPRADMTRGETRTGEPRSTLHSWEMPALTVQGHPSDGVREDDLIGSYAQPRWSARRRWTEVRSYVIPEGQFEFEYWLIVKEPKRRPANKVAVQHVYEAEIGLPYRFQLDLYQVYQKQDSTGGNALDETKFEVRWALADWDKIWGNPTLYAEWASPSGDYDVIESKLLLCDDLAPRWHWAANFVWEQRTGGDRFISREFKPAIAYGLIDEKLSVGLEAKFGWEDVQGDRGNYAREILVGPSVQLRPLPQLHLDVSYLVGCTEQSLKSKTALIAGWEF